MNRRTFLAGTGLAISGLAGCLSNADDGADDSGDDDADDSADDDADNSGGDDGADNSGGDDDADDSADDDADDSADDGADNSGDDDADNSGDDDADSVPVLTDYAVSDQVVAPDVEDDSAMDAWGLFLATRDAAEEHFGAVDGSGADAVRTFVDETAFDSGERLLYARAFARQTCYDLVLEGEPSVADNGLPVVRVGLDRTAPEDQPCGDAITAVDILLRLSFDLDAGSPDVVEVHVSGSLNDPEEFLLEAQR